MAKQAPEHFYLAVKRNYEETWRLVSQFVTRQEAESELAERRSWTGALNYDNAELRVISTAEAKAEFGADWAYRAPGAKNAAGVPVPREKKPPARRRKRNYDDD
jgi:hypothetical protein